MEILFNEGLLLFSAFPGLKNKRPMPVCFEEPTIAKANYNYVYFSPFLFLPAGR